MKELFAANGLPTANDYRFATQFRSEGAGPLRLYAVGDGVTDELRRLMGVPPLAEARAHEAELNKK